MYTLRDVTPNFVHLCASWCNAGLVHAGVVGGSVTGNSSEGVLPSSLGAAAADLIAEGIAVNTTAWLNRKALNGQCSSSMITPECTSCSIAVRMTVITLEAYCTAVLRNCCRSHCGRH
jgi:hypothetical protein